MRRKSKAKQRKLKRLAAAKKEQAAEKILPSQGDVIELFNAVNSGDVVEVRRIIEKGVDVNIYDENRLTALHIAAFAPLAPEVKITVINMLVKLGADVNAVEILGSSPIYFAIMQDDLVAIEAFISHGADINIKNKRQETPLSLARDKDQEIYRILKTYQSDPKLAISTIGKINSSVEDAGRASVNLLQEEKNAEEKAAKTAEKKRNRNLKQKERKRRAKAIIKMQKIVRGGLDRIKARNKIAENENRTRAAIQIQSMLRKAMAKEQVNHKREEKEAAIKMQSLIRSRKAIKDVEMMRQIAEHENQVRAAIKIQSLVRSRNAKKIVKDVKNIQYQQLLNDIVYGNQVLNMRLKHVYRNPTFFGLLQRLEKLSAGNIGLKGSYIYQALSGGRLPQDLDLELDIDFSTEIFAANLEGVKEYIAAKIGVPMKFLKDFTIFPARKEGVFQPIQNINIKLKIVGVPHPVEIIIHNKSFRDRNYDIRKDWVWSFDGVKISEGNMKLSAGLTFHQEILGEKLFSEDGRLQKFPNPNADKLFERTAYYLTQGFLEGKDVAKYAGIIQESLLVSVSGDEGRAVNNIIKFMDSKFTDRRDKLNYLRNCDALCGGIFQTLQENITQYETPLWSESVRATVGESYVVRY